MESGHRYRLLIYFAAIVLCLSVCFAYAESPASLPTVSYTPSDCTVTPAAQPARLLFNTAPGRSSFMPALTATLVTEDDSMQEEQPVMTATADAVLHGLNAQADHSHSLLHGIFPSHHKLKLVKAHAPEHLSAAATASPQMTGDESEAR